METLYRLVYTSARRKDCDDKEIQNILASCKKNNPGKNITGLLIQTENRFLQVIEGDKDEVLGLSEKIKKDPRHGGVNIRFEQKVDKRLFPNWHMAFKDISKDDIQFQSKISEEDKKSYEAMMEGDISAYNDRGMNVLKTFVSM
ncbi:BLUF domain-containing protein [Reichenbachiella ulvae]|uniref:BLUF domain-containing protein n=1 Tax=Reichenbachiella ulvae TaxID=2980104 RepID=A0ABT3CS25_9BACT|nr:BLUF domain-containing protein [Reichenbachiella ulvae]MCV9386511.1 BLUF domain-containing protein [Reichenbachiella ulvae]